MWKVIESKDHTTLVEVQSYFGFLVTGWTKVGTPSLEQLNSVGKILARNVHDAGIHKERGARKKYYLEKLKEREDQCEYSLSRMKDSVARDSGECEAGPKHKQSDPVKNSVKLNEACDSSPRGRNHSSYRVTQCQGRHANVHEGSASAQRGGGVVNDLGRFRYIIRTYAN